MTLPGRGRARRAAGLTGRALLVGVLLAGVALTLARIWQPAPGALDALVIRLAAVAPAALPAYAVAAVGSALLVRRWRPAVLTLVLALVGLGMHGWWFAPMLVDDAPEASDGPRVRVLTVNALVHSGASGEDLLELADSADADVVVVEEVGGASYEEALRAGLETAYPHGSWPPTDGATATMVWSRLPLDDLRPVPGASGCLRVTVRAEGRDLDLLGVHTGPPVWPRVWREDHVSLLAEVRRDLPDVMAGDFNATLDHVQLRRLLGEGLHDAGDLRGSGWVPTWPSNGRQRLLGVPLPRFAAIDHVLVSEGWTVLRTERLDVPRSDHTAVLAEVAPVAGDQSQ